jgi:hypothetical protein
MRKSACWIGGGLLVILAARSLAYALSPSPLARSLEHAAGGPSLPAVAVAALAIGVALAAAVVWLAALGVRERARLERVEAPRLRLRRLLLHAAALFAATLVGFTLLESYLHWRAGLGWHGLHCLLGPVHRNAIPILAALSLVAAALAAALEHVLAWMRRTIASVAVTRPRFAAPPLRVAIPGDALPPLRLAGATASPRAPPGARHVPGT